MELYIFRHSIAAPRGLGQEDGDRILTPEGRAIFGTAAKSLKARGLALDKLYMSPYQRTRETAAFLADCLTSGEPEATDLLLRPPGMELLELLQSAGQAKVALVGHHPYVGELTALLTFGERRLGSKLAFAPGTMAYLEGRPSPQGMSLHSLTPQELIGADAP